MEKTKTASTGKKQERNGLYSILKQLVIARDGTTDYLKSLKDFPEDGRQKRLGEAQEKINAAMVNVAHVIGLDVLNQVENKELPIAL